jgi:Tfp pilus assembly protein PilW
MGVEARLRHLLIAVAIPIGTVFTLQDHVRQVFDFLRSSLSTTGIPFTSLINDLHPIHDSINSRLIHPNFPLTFTAAKTKTSVTKGRMQDDNGLIVINSLARSKALFQTTPTKLFP